MPPVIIDLLSSESEPPIPSSSAPAAVQDLRSQPSFVELSDDVEAPPSPKRRRLTPSPTRKPIWGTRHTSRVAVPSPRSRGSFVDIDSIVCGSSPPLPPVQEQGEIGAGAQTRIPKGILSAIDASSSSPLVPRAAPNLSSRTAALLAELDGNRLAGRIPRATTNAKKGSQTQVASVASAVFAPPSKAIERSARRVAAPLSSIEDLSSQPLPSRMTTTGTTSALTAVTAATTTASDTTAETGPKSRRGRLTTPEREERDAAKVAKAAEKAATKEAKAREKQLAADLAEVNRARHDKKISVGEMIVRLPESMRCDPNITILAKEIFSQLGVQVELVAKLQADADTDASNIEADVVSWKRKIRARFDDEAGHWVPIPRMEIREETSHVMCVIDAKRFVKMVQYDQNASNQSASEPSTPPGMGLAQHVALVREKYPSRKPIYLIEGLETFMRKSRTARNRSFQAAARAQEEPANSTGKATKRKRKPKDDIVVDDDTIENALLQLQVEFGCLIHHSTTAPDTSEWISHFTQHISTIPYRTHHSDAEASFCMDVGQVKTGDDKDDTYVKMLQEIVRVTLPVAYGIAAEYPSVMKLFEGLKRGGPLCLQDLRKCSNKNGAFTDARVGPALSRRIYKIFMCENADSMDV